MKVFDFYYATLRIQNCFKVKVEFSILDKITATVSGKLFTAEIQFKFSFFSVKDVNCTGGQTKNKSVPET